MASVYNTMVSSWRGWSTLSQCCCWLVLCSSRTGLQPCRSHTCCAGTLTVCVLSQGGELSRHATGQAWLLSISSSRTPLEVNQTLGQHSTGGQSKPTGSWHVVPTAWHAGCQPPWGLHAREERDYKTFVNGKGRFGERQTLAGCLGHETK